MKTRTLTLLPVLFYGLISCTKPNTCASGHTALLEDWTGFDGCGYVFILDDGSKLEPLNLATFAPLQTGLTYCITFDTVAAASICMVGQTVQITGMEPLE